MCKGRHIEVSTCLAQSFSIHQAGTCCSAQKHFIVRFQRLPHGKFHFSKSLDLMVRRLNARDKEVVTKVRARLSSSSHKTAHEPLMNAKQSAWPSRFPSFLCLVLIRSERSHQRRRSSSSYQVVAFISPNWNIKVKKHFFKGAVGLTPREENEFSMRYELRKQHVGRCVSVTSKRQSKAEKQECWCAQKMWSLERGEKKGILKWNKRQTRDRASGSSNKIDRNMSERWWRRRNFADESSFKRKCEKALDLRWSREWK